MVTPAYLPQTQSEPPHNRDTSQSLHHKTRPSNSTISKPISISFRTNPTSRMPLPGAQYGWQLGRKFNVSQFCGPHFPPDRIEQQINGWTFMADQYGSCNADSIVIATDGGCRGNGMANNVAAIGVFVGQSSPYNVASILPAHRFPRRTNQVAELEAMSVALN